MKRIISTVAALAAVLAVGSSPALAEGEPSDADILNAKTVGVLPVLATGLSRQDTYRNVAAMTLRGLDAKPAGDGATLVPMKDDGGGMAFAGSSSTADIRILQYAFIAGGLASNAADPETYKKAVAFLESQREALASLSPALVSACDKYVAAAKAGRIDGESLVKALAAAEQGISAGPERAHGYFAVGIWLGISFIAVAAGEPDPDFYGMAVPLATLLEEDATFGGSDRALAKEVRAIGEVLSKPSPDLGALKKHLGAALAVEADAPAGE
ncbi:MAG: hypothetical protein EP329_27655 [Deltaproteobacteria bacterium]|nr:MAG: hypothetical protein EP329_27655 [Deltaproteobacteria bacterium]